MSTQTTIRLRPARVACGYEAAHHSADRVRVFCGRVEPVTLCGYHAQPEWLPAALNGQRQS